MVRRAALVVLVLVASVRADAPAIKNLFGFDWMSPRTSKCAQVTGALLTKLQTKYTCQPTEIGSASGKRIFFVCTAKVGKSEYLLLRSFRDCKIERDTQLENGAIH